MTELPTPAPAIPAPVAAPLAAQRLEETSDRKPVKNKELWLALDGIAEGRNIVYRWVKGHNGDTMNERVDSLASVALARLVPAEVA